jgi:uncharacterized repeat protein (TIGR01451 family)
LTWFSFINKITTYKFGQIETFVPITFNKASLQELPCVFSTIVPLRLIKRSYAFWASALLLVIFSSVTHASEEVVLRHSFAGNMSFELTGNTLRDSDDTCSAISGGSSSSTISLPSSSTIEAAYLYWSGSGSTDSTAIFNNQTVNADISYVETFESNDFYSSKADITSLVSNNTSTQYTVSGVTFDGSNTYCNTAGAYAGWAMIVIYENTSEPLRVINIFDGFRSFWGDDFDLVPNNFVIASNPTSSDGKHAHITWEGDEGNSQDRSNHSESLTFEDNDLTDFYNPEENQFNGYSNTHGADTSGVDIDEYEIGNYLTAGDTSVTTNYSSGQDAVFLTAEIISVPNEPVAELSIEQSGPTSLIRGEENAIDFTITNNGPSTATENSEFTLTIPDGLSFVSTTSALWSCSVTDDELTCLYDAILLEDDSTSLALLFTIDNTLENDDSVNLTGTITGVLFDNILSNNTSLASYIISGPDVTTSTKEVIDINGGNVESGDVLRYTITITESAGYAVNNLSLTDHISSNFSEYTIISLPNGTTDNSQQAPAGNYSAGFIQIDDISILANGSQEIIFDATLSTSLVSGTEIDNSITLISSATGTNTVSAPTVYISQAVTPSSGNKLLYLHSDGSAGRTDQIMMRSRPTSIDNRNLWRNGYDGIWTLSPAFQSQFEFNGTSIDLNLCLQTNQSTSITHTMQLQLLHNSDVIADSGNLTVTLLSNVSQFPYTIDLSSTPIIQSGDTLELRIVNLTGEGGIRVYSMDGSDYCYVSIPAKTVINVDSITVVDEDGTSINEASAGTVVSIEAVISDPFGSFDITSADLTATDAEGNTIFTNVAMTEIYDSGIATKTFSYNYTVPEDASVGYWNFSVRAKEGEEDTINHSSDFMLLVSQALPEINVSKTVEVYSDPIHGTNSATSYAKAFPGAILTYTVTAENIGEGSAQDDSIWISDSVPANTYMFVTDYDGVSGQGPVLDETANTSNGLTYTFNALDDDTDDIEFSNNGTDFSYDPTEDSEGLDKSITHFRINPKGIFQAPAAGENSNEFTIKFRVQLQ